MIYNNNYNLIINIFYLKKKNRLIRNLVLKMLKILLLVALILIKHLSFQTVNMQDICIKIL